MNQQTLKKPDSKYFWQRRPYGLSYIPRGSEESACKYPETMCKPVAATTSQQTLIRDIEMWMLSNMPFGFIFNHLKMVSSFSRHRPYENRWWTRFALWASVCQPLLSHQLKNMTDQEPGRQPPLLGRVVFPPQVTVSVPSRWQIGPGY